MNPEESLKIIESGIPSLFLNDRLKPFKEIESTLPLSREEVNDAENLMLRFAPLLVELFPELRQSGGLIESPFRQLKSYLPAGSDLCPGGEFWLKCDHQLPISGSVKARGGFYEVLWYAEKLAMEHGVLKREDDYRILAGDEIRELFSRYSIEVGSTGNLGLSIGIMGRALGFQVRVHMSADAREWKKNHLKTLGATVIEYDSDYSVAVKAGRKSASGNPDVYFIDDENSRPLFLGYSFAALRLRGQLDRGGVTVDGDHPLFVYLPCGVGGAPGGICFGLKLLFGDNVHCFFAEPVQAPAMTLAMLHRFELFPSTYDYGLKIKTEADGLAVGTASPLVGHSIQNMLSGCYTVTDRDLFIALYHLYRNEKTAIEPSAAAGCMGPEMICGSRQGKSYLRSHNLSDRMKQATHIIWATGGSLVPEDEFDRFYQRGKRLMLQLPP